MAVSDFGTEERESRSLGKDEDFGCVVLFPGRSV
jgi:hypothetical protein